MVESEVDDGSIGFIHSIWKYMHTIGYFPLVHRGFTAFNVLKSHPFIASFSKTVRFYLLGLFPPENKELNSNPFHVYNPTSCGLVAFLPITSIVSHGPN
jgi:hypothetical protein